MNETLQRINKVGTEYQGVFTVLGAVAGGLLLVSMLRRVV